jgi:hypothetical protein
MASIGTAGKQTCKGQSDPHSSGVVQGVFGSLVGRWVLAASLAVPAARLAVPALRQAELQGSADLFQDSLGLASTDCRVRRSRQ